MSFANPAANHAVCKADVRPFYYPPPPGGGGRRSLTEGEDGDAPRRRATRPAQREAPARDHNAAGARPLAALRRNDAGLRFRKQHAADGYVLDFYCAPARLAIEVDGEAHSRGDRPMRDAIRDAWLATQGVRVLRYPASDVLSNLEGVVREIMTIALERWGRFEN